MNTRSLLLLRALFLLRCIVAEDFPDAAVSAPDRLAENLDDSRVIGGYRTAIEDHPYQVSLRFDGRYRCGGAIISEEWVLTAAHCIKSAFASSISVKAGSSTLAGPGQVRAGRDVLVHEDYTPRRSDSDLALIQLEAPLELGDRVRPIELPGQDEEPAEGASATISGWGIVERGGPVSNQLREVSVPVLGNDECARLYGARRISPRMVCAGYVGEGGKDACQGDSGGPLVQDGRLIGIVSWGFGCGHPSYPGVYTRVAALRSWISEKSGV